MAIHLSFRCPECALISFNLEDVANRFCGHCKRFDGDGVRREVHAPEDLQAPSDSLTFWVIYDHPADYPKGYVLRAQYALLEGIRLSSIGWCGDTVDELHGLLPPATRIGPEPGDDPVILEVWMDCRG